MGTKVSPSLAFLYLLKNDRWQLVEEASCSAAHPAHKAAYVATRLVMHPSVVVDFQDPVSAALLGQLKDGGLITVGDVQALQALSA